MPFAVPALDAPATMALDRLAAARATGRPCPPRAHSCCPSATSTRPTRSSGLTVERAPWRPATACRPQDRPHHAAVQRSSASTSPTSARCWPRWPARRAARSTPAGCSSPGSRPRSRSCSPGTWTCPNRPGRRAPATEGRRCPGDRGQPRRGLGHHDRGHRRRQRLVRPLRAGPEAGCPRPRPAPADDPVARRRRGVGRSGRGRLGAPLAGVAWLAATARSYGRPLRAGEICSPARSARWSRSARDRLRVKISGLGSARVAFAGDPR